MKIVCSYLLKKGTKPHLILSFLSVYRGLIKATQIVALNTISRISRMAQDAASWPACSLLSSACWRFTPPQQNWWTWMCMCISVL